MSRPALSFVHLDWSTASRSENGGIHQCEIDLANRNWSLRDLLNLGQSKPRIFWSSKGGDCQAACFGQTKFYDSPSPFDRISRQEILSSGRWYFIEPFPEQNPTPDSAFNYIAILPKLEIRKEHRRTSVIYRSETQQNPAEVKQEVSQLLAPQLQEKTKRAGGVSISPDQSEWNDRIDNALQRIDNDELEKVVLGCTLHIKDLKNSTEIFSGYLGNSGDGYRYWFDLGERQLIGKSPERLFKRNHDSIEIDIIAGTRVGENVRLEDFSYKEIQEHKLVRSGVLETLTKFGARITESSPSVIKLKQLNHISTKISATIDSGADTFELMHHLHPTPAIGGYPQKLALAAISSAEGARGWNAGLCGFIDEDSCDIAVSIRSIQINGDAAEAFAGCGIVKGSTPADEWDEAQAKLQNIWGTI